MRSSENLAVIAVAGSGKTQRIIDQVLAHPEERALIVTYTLQNQLQIEQRIRDAAGALPGHVRITGWMAFLLNDGVRPYQHAWLGAINQVRGLNFDGQPVRGVGRHQSHYYLDPGADVYGRNLADLACTVNAKCGGDAVRRLEAMYDHVYIDEVQDLAGYDLSFLELLFDSTMAVTIVGDPRQSLLATARVQKNKRYRGAGFSDWLDQRSAICRLEDLIDSWRCHQDICDFASALFPDYPAMVSRNQAVVEHSGIHQIDALHFHEYVATHQPRILRNDKRADSFGHPAINFGEAKGHTYDHVLIITTGPIRAYLKDRDASKLKAPDRFYVAVTRARHSVAFLV
jgi:DNA helicase II / ATP-dependent DNA helicase PcrA